MPQSAAADENPSPHAEHTDTAGQQVQVYVRPLFPGASLVGARHSASAQHAVCNGAQVTRLCAAQTLWYPRRQRYRRQVM